MTLDDMKAGLELKPGPAGQKLGQASGRVTGFSNAPESSVAARLSKAFDEARATSSGTWGQLLERVVAEEMALYTAQCRADTMPASNAGLEQMAYAGPVRSIHEPEEQRIKMDRQHGVQSGWQGPDGFVPYPGEAACGKPFAQWLLEDLVRCGHRPIPSGYQPEGAHCLFTRSEVLTVLRAYRALHAQTTMGAARGCVELCAIFERME